jgi:simple sugar transport system ATP-binding protein
MAERVHMSGIGKRFGEIVALDGVDFTAARGEIHGLLGENGAGKTTLMNVLSGLYRADRGQIAIDGAIAAIAAPSDALRHGIGMVHQHVELIPTFSALENVLLGREGGRLWLRPERYREDIEALAGRFGLGVELDVEVRRLAVGVQQKVEILRSLYRGVGILILDEPTTMLTPQEVDTLFGTLRAMADQGLTVVFITHKIREILANCDHVTVMRGGLRVATLARAEMDEGRLVELMIGERLQGTSALGQASTGDAMLDVRDLAVQGERGRPVLAGCTFRVGAREVVGVAGVAGNGQRELADALAGALPTAAGRILLGDRDVTAASVRARIAAGLVVIPEDRIADGLLPGLSLAENLVLGLHPFAFGGGVGFDRGRARALAREAIAEYAIRARSEDAPAVELSGGNIQKMLVARAMAQARAVGRRLLVATNPTRGLDVRATEFVRRRCLAFAEAGGGVLLISEDLDELRQLCHRILVMFRGAIVADLSRDRFDPYEIGRLMAGAASPAAP